MELEVFIKITSLSKAEIPDAYQNRVSEWVRVQQHISTKKVNSAKKIKDRYGERVMLLVKN